MTERLRTLLREEADDLLVPAPDVRQILRQGGRRRLGRPVGTGLAAAAAVTAVVAGSVVLSDSAPGEVPDVSQAFAAAGTADQAYRRYGAFSVGSTVFVGNQRVRFAQSITSLYYTSEGVLVRLGTKVTLDDAGPSSYVLVSPDGSTRAIDLTLGDRVPGTDPDSPYLTYADAAEEGPLVERCFEGVRGLEGGAEPERQCHQVHEPRRYDLVAVDLRTGTEAHRATYAGTFTWGGWEAPPVTTHGDAVWALFDDGWVEHDWAAGTTRLVPGTKGSPFEAAGGVYLREIPVEAPDGVRVGDEVRVSGVVVGKVAEVTTAPDGEVHVMFETDGSVGPAEGAQVRDLRTGEQVLEIPPGHQPAFWLSPTGETVRVEGFAEYDDDGLVEPPGPSRFVHLGTGKVVPIPGDRLLGWTPDGDALAVDTKADLLSVCDAHTGRCHDVSVELPDGTVRLGGKSYES